MDEKSSTQSAECSRDDQREQPTSRGTKEAEDPEAAGAEATADMTAETETTGGEEAGADDEETAALEGGGAGGGMTRGAVAPPQAMRPASSSERRTLNASPAPCG